MKTLYAPALLASSLLLHPTAHAAPDPASNTVCQSQVLLPALYQAKTETVTLREPSASYTTTPVRMGYGERKVKVADAYVEYAIIPAKFGEVTETVEVERERVEIETLPATYRTETKRIKVKEATQRWNPACPQVLASQEGSVPANCLLEVPAEYTAISRQVIDIPARTIKKIIPARTETVTRKVLLEPAQVVRKEIPAVYSSVKLARVEETAKLNTSPIPAETREFPTQQKSRPERIVQMPALCETSISADKILQLQQRLHQLGYYTGTPEGLLGPKTRTALTRYQEDHQLASGAITLETLQKLQLQ